MSNTRKTTGHPVQAPDVFDLDAHEREANYKPFPFKLGGRIFQLPHQRKLDRKILAAADRGDAAAMDAAFRVGLAEEFEEFDALPLSLDGLDALFRAWMRHSGTKPGESPASPSS